MKQANYKRLLKMRHSLPAYKDTIAQQWPQDIEGQGRGMSGCKESDCSEYVSGDKRSYIWEFLSDPTGLYTRVRDIDNHLIRVYNAQFDSTGIRLSYESDSSAKIHMVFTVELNRINQNLFKGIQNIRFNNNCHVMLSLYLSRDENLFNHAYFKDLL